MPASELLERIDELVTSLVPRVSDEVRAELDTLSRRLREPARVAVVGRVKAGKSTLVNALLGQRVAPTDVSECTRLVTWYRYGQPQRVELALRDGTRKELMLTPEGMLPGELGVPPETVASIDVFLANETLRDFTLIDTPGIGSVNREFSAATEEFLNASAESATATAAADAVIFMLNTVVMQDELAILEQLHGDPTNRRSAVSTIGVLGRADQLGDGSRDSWQIALELADRFSATLRNDVATVVPVIGLIAESSEAATLTEHDARSLRLLSEMEPKAFTKLTWSADRFLTGEAPLDEDVRARLLSMLDLYGIVKAVNALRSGATGAVGLRRQLSGLSGISEVKRTLVTYFRDQDHVLKARSALELLRKLSFNSPGQPAPVLAELREAVEALQLDPLMHPIVELETLHDLCTARVSLPPDLDESLRRLLSAGGPSARLGLVSGDGAPVEDRALIADAARAAMGRWRTFMVGEASPAQARVARVALRSLQLIWERAAT